MRTAASISHVATLGLIVVLAAPVSAQTRPFTAADMLEVVGISGAVAMSPDGTRAAFVLPDLTDEWNVAARVQVGVVHIVSLDGDGPAEPMPLHGLQLRSSHPVFSPDGTRVALFVEAAGVHQLGVWDSHSGSLDTFGEQLADRPRQAPHWAGNDRLFYARPVAPAPAREPARVEVLEVDDPLPGDAFFRRDGRSGLAGVDIRTGVETTYIPDDGSLISFDVAPDGENLNVRSGTRPGRVLWPIDGGTPVPFTEPTPIEGFTPGQLVPSPDSDLFAALAPDPSIRDPEIVPPERGMFTIARPFRDLLLLGATDQSRLNLTEGLDDDVRSPVWSEDGASLYFVATDNETYDETLYRYDVRSGNHTVLSTGRESFGSIQAIPGGLLASIQTATSPPDLWRIDGESGGRTRITHLNPQLDDFAFSEPELFHFDDRTGARLGALLLRATGEGAGADEPIITYVYEKLTPSIHRFQPRQQIFATHGYSVLMPNVKVRVGETGTSFVDAVVPAVAAVHEMGFTNGRACMWGGSFGAYATSFVITQTDIFDCAVSRATPPELFRNWASGRDRDSNNIESGQARMGGSPFEVPENYLSQSAFFHLDQVETPVLITHGLKDMTILYEEGAMMFYALRRLGKQATLVTYREGDHSLYRHSRADALDVHRRMLDWFRRYLR